MSSPKYTHVALVDALKEAAMKHPFVNSFTAVPDQDWQAKDFEYIPIIAVLELPFQTVVTPRGNWVRRVRLRMSWLDRPAQDYSESPQILQATSRCEVAAMAFLENIRATPGMNLDGDVVGMQVIDWDLGKWSGFRLEFDVNTALPIDGCDPNLEQLP